MDDNRQLDGKKCIFTTTDSDWARYSGSECTVLHELSAERYDKEDVGIMWEIKFEDGTKTDAFDDELQLSEQG